MRRDERKAATGDRRAITGRSAGLVHLGAVWFVGAVFLFLVGMQQFAPVEDLLLDPSAVGGRPWYVGLVTSLGVLGWAAAVGGCAVTSFVARHAGRDSAADAFRTASFLWLLLLLDDLFLLHSSLFPQLFGVSKSAVLVAELILAVLWVVQFGREIIRTRWLLLIAAAGAFAWSLGVDTVVAPLDGRGLLWEDGPKLLGIIALATWSVVTATDILRSIVTTEREGDQPTNNAEMARASNEPVTDGESELRPIEQAARVRLRRPG